MRCCHSWSVAVVVVEYGGRFLGRPVIRSTPAFAGAGSDRSSRGGSRREPVLDAVLPAALKRAREYVDAGIGRYFDFCNDTRPRSSHSGRTPDDLPFAEPLLAAA